MDEAVFSEARHLYLHVGLSHRLVAETLNLKREFVRKMLATVIRRRRVSEAREFNGKRYYRTEKGYWRCKDGKKGKTYLHRDVWLAAGREIPFGFDIHHADENKDNNALENLEAVPKKWHGSWHAKKVAV